MFPLIYRSTKMSRPCISDVRSRGGFSRISANEERFCVVVIEPAANGEAGGFVQNTGTPNNITQYMIFSSRPSSNGK